MECSGWYEVHTFLTVLHSVFKEMTVSSQFLSGSTASTCTGVTSVKKLKAFPCTATDFVDSIHFRKGEEEMCCTEWTIQLEINVVI